MDNDNQTNQVESAEKPQDNSQGVPPTDKISETMPIPPSKPARKFSAKWLAIIIAILLVIAGSVAAYFAFNSDDAEPAVDSRNSAAETEGEEADQDESTGLIDCGDQRWFADPVVGFAFCYPNEWGDANVEDAKFDPADSGNRQIVRFADKPNVIVGGVSDDWTTALGRDGVCLEPSNNVRELSDYNTEWHNLSGEGAAVGYAERSLPSSAGGYDITETVSDMLQSGVCVTAHKVIDGSRYRVVSAAYYQDFGNGVATPRGHMDSPNVLFTEAERTAFDALIASVVAH